MSSININTVAENLCTPYERFFKLFFLKIKLQELQMYLTAASVKWELALGHSLGHCCMLVPNLLQQLRLIIGSYPRLR